MAFACVGSCATKLSNRYWDSPPSEQVDALARSQRVRLLPAWFALSSLLVRRRLQGGVSRRRFSVQVPSSSHCLGVRTLDVLRPRVSVLWSRRGCTTCTRKSLSDRFEATRSACNAWSHYTWTYYEPTRTSNIDSVHLRPVPEASRDNLGLV